jgi:hypothetical protein
MADLVLTVEAQGTAQAAAGIDRVGQSVQRTGTTWDALKRKMGSGEVLRNAAASAALLGSGSGNATQKVAALGGALAAIPGPVGLVASAVAVAATVFDVFSKNAEAAEKAAAELAATLAGLGKQKVEAQVALAGRISGAAVRVGGDLRRFNASGGTDEGLAAAQALMPGDAGGALRLGAQVASGGLTGEQQKLAESTLSDIRSAGFELSKEVVARVIEGIKYEAEAFAGATDAQRRGGGRMEGESNRLGRFLDAVGADSATRGQLSTMGNRAFLTQAGGTNESLLRMAEAPAVAQAAAETRDAFGAGSIVAMDALKVATDKATGATGELTAAIVDLTGKISAAGGGGNGAAVQPQADSAWIDAAFAYGRGKARP